MRAWLAARLNEDLEEGVRVQVVRRGQTLALVTEPKTLLNTIYLHFAAEVTGGLLDRRVCPNPACPRAGEPFVPQRVNKHYCSRGCKEQVGYYRRRAAAKRAAP